MHEARVRQSGYDRIIRPGDDALLRPLDVFSFDDEKIKGYISEPDLDVRLRPLLLFHGGFQMGRTQMLFNYTRALMDANELDLKKCIQSINVAEDSRHWLGFHHQLAKFDYMRFLARLRDTEQVHPLAKGIDEYVEELIDANPSWAYFPLTRLPEISEGRVRSDRYWRKPAPKDRQPREEIAEFYPFIKGAPTSDHDLLLAVEALVPKGLMNDTRADVCQDMLVAILTGEVTLDNLRDARPKYLKQFLKSHPLKYGHLSLDAPVGYGDERTLGQKLGL